MTTLDFEHIVENLIKSISKHSEISKNNKDLLLRMKRDFSLDGLSPAWQQNMLSRMKQMAILADFNLDEADEERLKDLIEKVQRRDISDRTVVNYKGALKRFYKWLNNGEYPDFVMWMKTTYNEKNNTLPEDLLTEKDIFELIDAAKTTRDKAMIALLWETGARIGELIDLKVKDLRDYKHGFQVVISGKTGSRRLPLIASVPYLNNWLNNHPSRAGDSYLWCKIREATGEDRITYRYIRKMLEKTKERASIDKPVNPHHFRHSRATYLANRFTEAQLCEWFGWVQGSNVPAKYVHMSGRDIDGAYARLHGIEDEEELVESKMIPKECPRCTEKVPANAVFCFRCGQALTIEGFKMVEDGEQKIDEKTSELEDDVTRKFLEFVMEDEEIMKKFKKSINERG